LLKKPKFLLADEPTGNLDAETGKQIIELILAYQKKYGMGIIISSHDPMVLEALNITLEIQDGCLYSKEQ
jgi:ABC-type lipoprotein export system ATPase subunit